MAIAKNIKMFFICILAVGWREQIFEVLGSGSSTEAALFVNRAVPGFDGIDAYCFPGPSPFPVRYSVKVTGRE